MFYIIDKMLELHHELILPSNVYNYELLSPIILQKTKEYIESEKMTLLKINSLYDVKEFQKSFPNLGLGECDCILTYQKLLADNKKSYCILDDKLARKKAEKLGIKFTGLLGLLKLMRDRKILSKNEVEDIINALKRSNFRISRDFVI